MKRTHIPAEWRLRFQTGLRTIASALAGRRSFERGVEYVGDGRVGTINESDDAIEATVRGTDPYVVRISAANGQVFGYCSCPMGEGGAFCKHCVALSLVWVEILERWAQ